MEIAKALENVRENIVNSASKAGRDPDKIKLIAVTKTVKIEEILEAVKAGATILGENRVQEARDKIQQITPTASPQGIEWHLIGNLQKNKAKTAVRLFNLIHSVDSIELARVISKNAQQINKKQRVLAQVKLSEEGTKHGVTEQDVMKLIEQISEMKDLKLEGLMAMPPYFEDPEKTRPYFRRLREIRDEVQIKGYRLPELSMGMSNDFRVAIEEGSTMVRVGTSIFGARTY